MVTSKIVHHKEVCTDEWRCDIRNSNVPYVLAVAEADSHVMSVIAGDGHTFSRLEGGQGGALGTIILSCCDEGEGGAAVDSK